MSAAAKRRVDRATENLSGTCCLIENTDESNAVEYAHCLPRSTKNGLVSLPPRGLTRSAVINLLSQLDSLEYTWKMRRFTLNVDTRANVIRRTSPPQYTVLALTTLQSIQSSTGYLIQAIGYFSPKPQSLTYITTPEINLNSLLSMFVQSGILFPIA
jgi:hypothetical protein